MPDRTETPSADWMPDESPPQRPLPSLRARRLRVLGIALLVLVVGATTYALLPWILPIYIVEGPLVQQAGENSARLVWFTSRGGVTTFEIVSAARPGGARGAEETKNGLEAHTTKEGLEAHTTKEGLEAHTTKGGLEADTTKDEVEAHKTRNGLGAHSTTNGLGAHSTAVQTLGARHEVALRDLSPDTEYRYRIRGEGQVLIENSLRSAKTATQALTFVVFGDSGKGTRAQYRLAEAMTALRPDFVLHTGDLVYSAGERWRYRERFFRPYRDMLAQVAFWPSLGNHDVSEETLGAPYREVFSLPENGPPGTTPEANYWFDYGPLRVVVLDTNYRAPAGTSEADLESKVAPWIVQVMNGAPAWRVAVFHHPPYTAGKHTPDAAVQRVIVPALERAGVHVVFNGHDHLYERTHPMRGGAVVSSGAVSAASAPGAAGGITYIVTGAGGAKLYEALPAEQRPAYIAVLHNAAHSFTRVDADPTTMRLRQIDVDGRLLDDWTMRRPAAPALTE